MSPLTVFVEVYDRFAPEQRLDSAWIPYQTAEALQQIVAKIEAELNEKSKDEPLIYKVKVVIISA